VLVEFAASGAAAAVATRERHLFALIVAHGGLVAVLQSPHDDARLFTPA